MIIESEADLAAKVCVLTKRLGSPKVTQTKDYVSTMSFSQCGRYFALGDQLGRLVIFDIEENGELNFITQIGAHKLSHDWQTNREVAARINSVHWLECHNNLQLQILTCNQKYIKIWRVCQQNEKELDVSSGLVPEVIQSEVVCFKHTLKTELPDLHYGRILHTALSSNQETLISVDSDRFFRWNLERVDTAEVLFKRQHSILDDEDKEWSAIPDVTSVKFHGASDNMYGYSTKYGAVHYIDLRQTAKHKDSVLLQSEVPLMLKDFPNSKLLQIVSDFCFTGQYEVVTRNYLKTKIWDLRKPSKPEWQSLIYPAMLSKFGGFASEYSRNYLCDINKMDNAGRRLIMNHYDNSFHLVNLQTRTNHRIKIAEDGKPSALEIKKKGNPPDEGLTPQHRIECVGYHPDGKKVAVSTRNCVYFFDTFNY